MYLFKVSFVNIVLEAKVHTFIHRPLCVWPYLPTIGAKLDTDGFTLQLEMFDIFSGRYSVSEHFL